VKASPKLIEQLEDGQIFVFGSNDQGRHGAGAAYTALKKFGASYGRGKGLVGESYAIPTRKFIQDDSKNWQLVTLPVSEISTHINDFISFASVHKELDFLVTEVGCGHAGISHETIAPLFERAKDMPNIFLPEKFIHILERKPDKCLMDTQKS